MGVSLVYLGKNDDDNEMAKMCTAIAGKLNRANIQFREENAGEKCLPKPTSLQFNDVWFCGHSRFIEANSSVRKVDERNFGGYLVKEVAQFIVSALYGGKKKFRLICCESAQQQRYKPKKVGDAPYGMDAVIGKELLQEVSNPKLLEQFGGGIDARVSHLEGLIVEIATQVGDQKKASSPAFEICGLWGAGDITDDDVPISSFLQDKGSLEAQAKMDDEKVKELQRKAFKSVFENAHCTKQSLPDFFGYKIARDLLVQFCHYRAERD